MGVGGLDLFKIDGNGGDVWKMFLEKGRGKAKWGALPRKGEIAILYWGFSWDFPGCSIGKKFDVSIFPLLTNMCYKIVT